LKELLDEVAIKTIGKVKNYMIFGRSIVINC